MNYEYEPWTTPWTILPYGRFVEGLERSDVGKLQVRVQCVCACRLRASSRPVLSSLRKIRYRNPKSFIIEEVSWCKSSAFCWFFVIGVVLARNTGFGIQHRQL